MTQLTTISRNSYTVGSSLTPEATLTTTVPKEFVHLDTVAEVFLTGCIQLSATHFSLTGQWPRAHTFFTTDGGTRYDPLIAAVTIRQCGLYLAHAKYGIPLEHVFLLRDLDFTVVDEEMAIGQSPADIVLDASCPELQWQGRQRVESRMEFTIHRAGRLVATGSSGFACLTPAFYQRVRGERISTTTNGLLSRPAPVSPASVGRSAPTEVVLAPTGKPNRWLLSPDPRHPILFDHGSDHTPGMVLLEAARQAGHILLTPLGVKPTSAAISFHRYAELDTPCTISAELMDGSVNGERTAEVTAHQNGPVLFTAVLSGPTATARNQGPN
ncbi:ScbA/BarX family gamma-butyrolactone biosynthesis protein [Streptomyces sp. 7N604]|uniref:ScbA/BarX family gamma-butyrolactone biosynthesis protein n=1 Tax=Streptomyces sp. 7N604 TaxID=3457415 RepID=UPI003FD4D638